MSAISLTLENIQENPSLFISPNATEEEKKSQKMALAYILQLCALTKTNLEGENIVGLFGTGTGTQLLSEKTEINKRFFSFLTQKAEAQKDVKEEKKDKPKAECPEAVFNAINKFSVEMVRTQIASFENAIKTHKAVLASYFDKIECCNKAIVENRQVIDRMQGKDSAGFLKEQFNKVIQKGNWVNPVVSGEYLYLNTKENVVCTYKNKLAKCDITVNFGQLAVKFDLRTFESSVIPYKKNIRYIDLYHPHVNQSGHICWGDALKTSSAMQQEGRIFELLELLYTLLFTYNERNPYAGIECFEKHAQKYGRITNSELKHPDRVRDEKQKFTPSMYEKFEVGEYVFYQTQGECDNTVPRWDRDEDSLRNESEIYSVCKINEVGNNYINTEVKFGKNENDTDTWTWPIQGNGRYDSKQWERMGYLRKLKEITDFVPGQKVEAYFRKERDFACYSAEYTTTYWQRQSFGSHWEEPKYIEGTVKNIVISESYPKDNYVVVEFKFPNGSSSNYSVPTKLHPKYTDALFAQEGFLRAKQ